MRDYFLPWIIILFCNGTLLRAQGFAVEQSARYASNPLALDPLRSSTSLETTTPFDPKPGNGADTRTPRPQGGGGYLRGGALGISFHDRMMPGALLEVGVRSGAADGSREGHFSMGFRARLMPSLQEQTFGLTIGHVNELNLSTLYGDVPMVTLGTVPLRENDLFIMDEFPELDISGYLSLSPSGTKVIELKEYTLRDIHIGMMGWEVPVRWYFDAVKESRIRPVVEVGLGMDILRMRASYEVLTTGLYFDQTAFELTFDASEERTDEPLEGEVPATFYLTNWHLGAGISRGRFDLMVQRRARMSPELKRGDQDYERVRGNPFVLPILASADTDPVIREELRNTGVVHFGSLGLLKGEDEDSEVGSAKEVIGVFRFWQHITWSVSLSYRIF